MREKKKKSLQIAYKKSFERFESISTELFFAFLTPALQIMFVFHPREQRTFFCVPHSVGSERAFHHNYFNFEPPLREKFFFSYTQTVFYIFISKQLLVKFFFLFKINKDE